MEIGSETLQEIRKRKPFKSKGQEALLALLRTTDLVKRHMAGVIEPFGLTPQQYNVLRILREAEPEGLPTLEVAERMIEQTPGITRLLDRLELKGWVGRERDPEDRRQVICRITPAGLILLAQMDESVDEADDSALAMLSDAGKQRLIELLDSIRAACRG